MRARARKVVMFVRARLRRFASQQATGRAQAEHAQKHRTRKGH